MALPDKPTSTASQKEVLISEREKIPIVEPKPVKEVEPEVKDWLTKLETGEEIELPEPVTDDSGQALVSPVVPQQVDISLPLTEEEINRGLGLKIVDSFRWLAEWAKRLLKLAAGRFRYRLR